MSREIDKLSPYMQEKAIEFAAECHKESLDVVIICTDRSDEDQNACFASGASKCKAGQSAHNAKVKLSDGTFIPASEAFDIGVIRNGKYIGDGNDPDYQKAGLIGEKLGLVWAGRWTSFKEVAHFQNPHWIAPK